MAMEIMGNGMSNFGPMDPGPINGGACESPCLVETLNEIMRIQDDTMAMLHKLNDTVYGTGSSVREQEATGYRNMIEHAGHLANNQKVIARCVRELYVSLIGNV